MMLQAVTPRVGGSTPPEVKHVAVRASVAPEGSGESHGSRISATQP